MTEEKLQENIEARKFIDTPTKKSRMGDYMDKLSTPKSSTENLKHKMQRRRTDSSPAGLDPLSLQKANEAKGLKKGIMVKRDTMPHPKVNKLDLSRAHSSGSKSHEGSSESSTTPKDSSIIVTPSNSLDDKHDHVCISISYYSNCLYFLIFVASFAT